MPELMVDVRLNHEHWGNQVLVCPGCGSAYLHSGRVTVYDRKAGKEDAEHTTVTTVRNGRAKTTEDIPSGHAGNPSDRRHGVAVAFSCEGCDGKFELTFAQHKGVTLPAWRKGD